MCFNPFTAGCHPGRRADPHAWRMCYILRSHSDSPKDKLILMDTGRRSLTGQTQTFVTSVRPMALLTHWCWTKAAHVPKETNEVPLSSTEDETLHHQSVRVHLIRLSARGCRELKQICVCASLFLFKLAAIWWWSGAESIRQKGALVLQCSSSPPWSPLFLRAPHNGDLPEGGNVAFLGLWAHIP